MVKFYKRIAAPASGKSYGAVRYMLQQIRENNKKFVLAAISVELCKDLRDNLKALDKDLIIEVVIEATTPSSQRVRDKYEEHLQEAEADVIIITHSTLLNYKGVPPKDNWHMVVDELPNIVSMSPQTGTLTNDKLGQWLEYKHPDTSVGYREMGIKVGWESTLEKELAASERVAKGEGFIDATTFQILQGILSGDTSILRSEYLEDNVLMVKYYSSTIRDPNQVWRGFEEVTFLCAEFEKQLTGIVFKHKYGIVVPEKEDILLRSTEYKSPERIKIYPLLLPPTTFTKKTSRSYYDKSTGSKYPKEEIKEGLTEVFEHLVDVAATIVGEQGYIYTVNKFRTDQITEGAYGFLSERDKVSRLKYNPHGLNRFMDFNIALGLFHCNPSPYQLVLLRHIAESCGVEDKILFDGYETTAYLDPIFQLVTRTAIRDFEDLQEIICIVPDYRVAKYLTDGWFKGATVDYKYAVSIKDNRVDNSRPTKFQGLFKMSNTEKSAYTRWVKSLGKTSKSMSTTNNEHMNMVTEWINKRREV